MLVATLTIGLGCRQQVKPEPAATAPTSAPADATRSASGGRDPVVWVSVDGLRGDYVGKYEAPFLKRLMDEGAWTRKLTPIFPSLTFPSHASEATGVPAGEHGITGNKFYDSTTGETVNFPNDSSLMLAEPIWMTASRQGVRTAVIGWPLSYQEKGPNTATYFRDGFQRGQSDGDRLQDLLEIWKRDNDEHKDLAPLRLVMGYVEGVDTPGHRFGPDSQQVAEALAKTDATLQGFFDQARAIFASRARPGDRLWFIVTADHGMTPVKTMVNLKVILGAPELPAATVTITNSEVIHFFVNKVEPASAREALVQRLLAVADRHEYLRAWRRADLPKQWNYANATRTGDVVYLLRPGFVFADRLKQETFTVEQANGPFGMHGYPPAECADMSATGIFWCNTPAAHGDLGAVDSLRLHPTVARILGIKPAAGAIGVPLDLESP